MNASAAPPKAFAVRFKDLARWSVGSFISLRWQWPRSVICPLSDSLRRKTIAVDRKATSPEALQLVTLHFDGCIEPRLKKGNRPIKGRLWWAEPGDVIYSKIDVRHGAIGIVPYALGRVCVTSEYPVYAVDSGKVEARYVKLLFRTSTFRQKISGMISGASGRKRVPPADIENVEVPMPSLPIQRAIVSAWERAQAKLADIRLQIAKLESNIETDLLADLGLTKPKRANLPKVLAVCWKDLERWSVMFNQLANINVDISSGKYPVAALTELASVSYGIQKCKANRPGQYARPYLRVANVQRGELDLEQVKTINVPDADMSSFRLEPGDLLVCEGNSADLVGRPAMWHGEIPDCVHQNHILKVRTGNKRAIPEYLLEYMQTTPARIYFRSRAKFTTNLASINSTDLRELPIALPPLPIQRKLVAKVAAQRELVAELKAEAAQREQDAKADVEAMILGEKPIAA